MLKSLEPMRLLILKPSTKPVGEKMCPGTRRQKTDSLPSWAQKQHDVLGFAGLLLYTVHNIYTCILIPYAHTHTHIICIYIYISWEWRTFRSIAAWLYRNLYIVMSWAQNSSLAGFLFSARIVVESLVRPVRHWFRKRRVSLQQRLVVDESNSELWVIKCPHWTSPNHWVYGL